jgi:SAM-dependent methyltransferase
MADFVQGARSMVRYLPQTIRRPLRKVCHAIIATRRYIGAQKDFASARTALLAGSDLYDTEKEMLRKISQQISMADDMYLSGNARHYLSVGLSAMRCITRVLDHLAIDRSSIRSVLDLPSGGGRVLRFLQIAFPNATIVACDTNGALVEFCRKAFGARAVRSVPDFNQLHIPGTFDLIWCGSLLTHIDEPRCADLLRLFYNHLSPEGVCMFSTHGPTVEWLQGGGRKMQSLRSQLADVGFGYFNDDDLQSEYGTSVVERDRMVGLAERVGKWSLAAFLERGWDNHHDVYAFTKRNIAPPIQSLTVTTFAAAYSPPSPPPVLPSNL